MDLVYFECWSTADHFQFETFWSCVKIMNEANETVTHNWSSVLDPLSANLRSEILICRFRGAAKHSVESRLELFTFRIEIVCFHCWIMWTPLKILIQSFRDGLVFGMRIAWDCERINPCFHGERMMLISFLSFHFFI